MTKPKLNQIIAVVTGMKTRNEAALKDAHRWQQQLLQGQQRTYRPKDEDGEKLPGEKKAVQLRVQDVLKQVAANLTEFWDAVATQETGNTTARADIVIDGVVVVAQVPVTVLLFLEKQLLDLQTFVGGIPTLPTEHEWDYDENSDLFVTEPTETVRTKKIPTRFVKQEPTKEHPAQVEIIYVDEVAGYWTQKLSSGAIPVKQKTEYQDRVRKLLQAVKVAREEANSVLVDQQKIGKFIMGYLFDF